MKYALIFTGSIAFFLFCMTAGTAWDWKIGRSWGRKQEEKKWKKERGLNG